MPLIHSADVLPRLKLLHRVVLASASRLAYFVRGRMLSVSIFYMLSNQPSHLETPFAYLANGNS